MKGKKDKTKHRETIKINIHAARMGSASAYYGNYLLIKYLKNLN